MFGEAEHSAEEVGRWIDEEGGVAGGVVAVDDVGRVGGFVSPGRRETVFLADPALTDPLVDELLPWLREQRDVVQLLASGADTARVRALQRHGLRYSGRRSRWRAPIAPDRCLRPRFPTGVHVVPYRLGDSDDSVHRLTYVMLRGHPSRDMQSATSTGGAS